MHRSLHDWASSLRNPYRVLLRAGRGWARNGAASSGSRIRPAGPPMAACMAAAWRGIRPEASFPGDQGTFTLTGGGAPGRRWLPHPGRARNDRRAGHPPALRALLRHHAVFPRPGHHAAHQTRHVAAGGHGGLSGGAGHGALAALDQPDCHIHHHRPADRQRRCADLWLATDSHQRQQRHHELDAAVARADPDAPTVAVLGTHPAGSISNSAPAATDQSQASRSPPRDMSCMPTSAVHATARSVATAPFASMRSLRCRSPLSPSSRTAVRN